MNQVKDEGGGAVCAGIISKLNLECPFNFRCSSNPFGKLTNCSLHRATRKEGPISLKSTKYKKQC